MWHEITFQNIVEYFPEVINLTESDFNLAYQNSGYVDGDVFSMWESNMDDFDKIEIIMELEKLCNFLCEMRLVIFYLKMESNS